MIKLNDNSYNDSNKNEAKTQQTTNYPHFLNRELVSGFSNWITPSRGTFSWVTIDIGCSSAKLEEGFDDLLVTSALTITLLRFDNDDVEVDVDKNLGRRLEKRGGFGWVNLGGWSVCVDKAFVAPAPAPEEGWVRLRYIFPVSEFCHYGCINVCVFVACVLLMK